MLDTFVNYLTMFGYALSGFTFTYYVLISVSGWFRKKTPDPNDFPISNRFAVVIPAHNENTVIANTVASIKASDYPLDMVDIYVIADNCSDNTADLARTHGAIVLERTNTVEKGKGYALTWMFEKLWKMDKNYDAVCILDADNWVDKSFFKEMNKSLQMGHQIIQGYMQPKNPEDSWVAGCFSIEYWLKNRLIQLPRFQIGLSCSIVGSGFVVCAKWLREIGWDSHCLTEDLEFQLKAIDKGIKIAWNHDAIFFVEKPITLKQSLRQRTRWMQGHTDCLIKFAGKLVRKGVKEKDAVALDTLFTLVQAYLLSIIWVITILSISYRFIMGIFVDPSNFIYVAQMLGGMELLMMGYGIFLYVERKLNPKILLYLAVFPFYLFTWLIPIYLGWVRRKDSVWVHTEHGSAPGKKPKRELLSAQESTKKIKTSFNPRTRKIR